MRTEQWRNDTDRGKPKYLAKKLFHYTLSPTNPTRTSLGLTWTSAMRSQQPVQFLLNTNLNEVNIL